MADGYNWIDSASDPDQEYIYFMWSDTLPSARFILSDESSIPFYSTSNGYKNTDAIVCFILFSHQISDRSDTFF